MRVPLRIGGSSSGTFKPGLGLGVYDEYDVRAHLHDAIRAIGGAGEADKLPSANGLR